MSNTMSNKPRLHNSPFPGFNYNETANKQVEAGAQKKAKLTGMYKKVNSGKNYYIKRSQMGDDLLEVFSAKLFQAWGANAASCDFVSDPEGNPYVASACFEGCQPIIPKKERSFSNGKWLGSNPISAKNKNAIYKKLKTDRQKQDVADILAASLLGDDKDCQIGNLIFYTERLNLNNRVVEKIRVGKIDHGWALADICKSKKSRKVDVFSTVSPIAKRGSHKLGAVPTNHFKDFPKIINSAHFIRALDCVIRKSDAPGALENTISSALTKTLSHADTVAKQKTALLVFSKQIGLKIPKQIQSVPETKAYLIKHLHQRLADRRDSMALLKVLMQLKLKCDVNGKFLSPKARLEALKEVIEQRFKGRDFKPFMPSFKPSIKKLLGNLLKECKGRHIDLGLIKFCEEIRQGKNPTKRFVRPVITSDKIKSELDKIRHKYHARSRSEDLSEARPVSVLTTQFGHVRSQSDTSFVQKDKVARENAILVELSRK